MKRFFFSPIFLPEIVLQKWTLVLSTGNAPPYLDCFAQNQVHWIKAIMFVSTSHFYRIGRGTTRLLFWRRSFFLISEKDILIIWKKHTGCSTIWESQEKLRILTVKTFFVSVDYFRISRGKEKFKILQITYLILGWGHSFVLREFSFS